jgi:sulfide:quinone oxidoreductase
MTARQAGGMGSDVDVVLVSPEERPLERFGPAASREVAAELEAAGVRFEGGADATVERGRGTTLVLRPGDRRVEVDRVVALPRLEGRAPAGIPTDPDGFIEVEESCRVRGLERTWAAGDGIAFPVKFGGLAAEQADAAAADIARRAGADVEPEPFHPVLRGRLLTGRGSRYVRFDAGEEGDEGQAADHALWWPPGKVAGRRLAPYLAARDDAAVAPSVPEDAGVAVQADLDREV